MSWQLAIDFGTSFTSAAIRRDGRTDMLELSYNSRKLPSAVLLQEDGSFVVGDAAVNQATLRPTAFLRTPKRRMRKDDTVLLGGRTIASLDPATAVFSAVMEQARSQQPLDELDEIVLTHPAKWAGPTQGRLVTAMRNTGMCGDAAIRLDAEPVAAARYYVHNSTVEGDLAAVYDLGGGTLDTAVLRRNGENIELLGRPGGDEDLGGEDFDDRVVSHILEGLRRDDDAAAHDLMTSTDPEWSRARHELRKGATETKEMLSTNAQYAFHIPHPISKDVTLTRSELNELIQDDLERSVDLLADTINEAEAEARGAVSVVFLVGGSSRTLAVHEAIRRRFGERARSLYDPKDVVALGATLSARPTSRSRPEQPQPPPPRPSSPPKDTETEPKAEPKPVRIPDGTVLATAGQRVSGWLLDSLLSIVTLYVGWLAWAIVGTWPVGQTPGKGIIDLYVIDEQTGRQASTSKMAVRFALDLAVGVASIFLLLIPFIVNSAWIFSNPKRQRLTDVILSTVVVHDPSRVLKTTDDSSAGQSGGS